MLAQEMLQVLQVETEDIAVQDLPTFWFTASKFCRLSAFAHGAQSLDWCRNMLEC